MKNLKLLLFLKKMFPMRTQGNKPLPELTIERVKECIAFPKESGIYVSLSGMCDCWYGIAKNEGKTDEQAATIALDKLGAKMLELSK